MRPASYFRGAAAALIVSAALGAAPAVALASEPASVPAPAASEAAVASTTQTEATTEAAAASATKATTGSEAASSSATAGSTSAGGQAGASEGTSSSDQQAAAKAGGESGASAAATSGETTTDPATPTDPSAETPAEEEPLEGETYVIQNEHDGTRGVVDVSAGSHDDGANVQLYGSNGTAAQQWEFERNDDGSYTIRNVNSGKVLDVACAEFKDGGNVWQYEPNGSAAQRWTVKWVDRTQGLAYLLLAAHPELALDASGAQTSNGTNLQLWHANGTAAQLWRLRSLEQATKEAARLVAGGLDVVDDLDGVDYTIVSNADGRDVTVGGGSRDGGAGLIMEDGTSADRQAYRITREGDYWRIQNVRSGLSLAADVDDVVPGAGIRQRANSADDSQLWVIYRKDGAYGFINKQTGLVFSNRSGLFSGVTFGTAGDKDELFRLESWVPSVSDGVYRIASRLGNSQALDVAAGSAASGANVQDYAWNGTTAQRWYVSRKDGGYAITNLGSGLRLATDGTNVVQAGNSFLWRLGYVLGAGLSLVDPTTGRALDVSGANASSGANVQTWAENGTLAQVWNLVGINAIDDGWYTLRSALDTGKALDLDGAAYDNGANVQLWGANDSDAQRWYVYGLGNGYYTLVSGASNKVLTADGDAGRAGTNVDQQTGRGTSAQRWRLQFTDGQVTFVNESGKVLDVSGASTADGANVQIWDSNGTTAQRWLIRSCGASETMGRLIDFENKMLAMANDDSHGYDQDYRWGEYGDYDCSSLVISCLDWAGFGTGSATYTGNLRWNLQARGWQWIGDVNPEEAQPGDIMLSEVHHVAAMISHTQMVEARGNEWGGATGGRHGDQTGDEICVSPWRAQRGLHTSEGWDGILRFTGYC